MENSGALSRCLKEEWDYEVCREDEEVRRKEVVNFVDWG
jgi:hypothetical protein